MADQPGFFDLSERYKGLSAAGDPLERLLAVVDYEVFRGPLVAALRRSARSKGSRPPFYPVLMFKIWCCRRCTHSRTRWPSSSSGSPVVPALPRPLARQGSSSPPSCGKRTAMRAGVKYTKAKVKEGAIRRRSGRSTSPSQC